MVRRHPALDHHGRWRPTPSATEIIQPPRRPADPQWILIGAVALGSLIIALSLAIAAASLLPL